MRDFRVKLHTVEATLFTVDAGCRACAGVGCCRKTIRYFRDNISVAHPCDSLFRQIKKQRTAAVQHGLCFAVFSGKAATGRNDNAPILFCQHLAAVTDSEDRDTEPEDPCIRERSVICINARRSAGKDYAGRAEGFDFVQWNREGHNFAVDAAFPYAACNQPAVLPSKIQYQYFLL